LTLCSEQGDLGFPKDCGRWGPKGCGKWTSTRAPINMIPTAGRRPTPSGFGGASSYHVLWAWLRIAGAPGIRAGVILATRDGILINLVIVASSLRMVLKFTIRSSAIQPSRIGMRRRLTHPLSRAAGAIKSEIRRTVNIGFFRVVAPCMEHVRDGHFSGPVHSGITVKKHHIGRFLL